MTREEFLTRLKTVLESFDHDIVTVDETLLLGGRVPALLVTTKQHEEFVIRVEEV